jgi:hypothetical protein
MGLLEIIPFAIIDHILVSYLNIPDLISLLQCNHGYYKKFNDVNIWKLLLKRFVNKTKGKKYTNKNRQLMNAHKIRVIEKWQYMISTYRSKIHYETSLYIEKLWKYTLGIKTKELFQFLQTTQQIVITDSQSKCSHSTFLYLCYNDVYSTSIHKCTLPLQCYSCQQYCYENIYICSICTLVSTHLFCTTCKQTKRHYAHPFITIPTNTYHHRYHCGCMSCGVSCIIGVGNDTHRASTTSSLILKFISIGPQNVFRNIAHKPKREALLANLRPNDFVVSTSYQSS